MALPDGCFFTMLVKEENIIKSDDFNLAQGLVMAAKLYQEGKYTEVIETYNKILELQPENAHVFFLRGRCFVAKKMYDQAITDFSRAIELDEENYIYYFVRAKVYSDKQLFTEAIVDYDKAIELNPEDYSLYDMKSAACFKSGNYLKALETCDKGIELNPQHAMFYLTKSVCYEKLGDKENTSQNYQKFIYFSNITKKTHSEEKKQDDIIIN